MAELDNNAQLKEIVLRITAARQFVQNWRDNITKWRLLYEGRHYEGIPSRTNEIRYADPTFANTVDLAVGIMLANSVIWHARGWKPTYQEEIDSSALEKFLYGAICANDRREEASLFYQLFMNFVRDGGGAVFSVWDDVIASGVLRHVPAGEDGSEEGYVLDDLPLRIKVIDPLSLLLLPGGYKRWLVMGREEDKTVLDVEVQFGVSLPEFSYMTPEVKSTTKGAFVDYWDYGTEDGKQVVRNALLFNNNYIPGFELRPMPGYESLPYTVQFFKPASPNESGKYQSIMTVLVDSVKLLERSINRRQRQIDIYSSLPIVTKTRPGRSVTTEGLGAHVQLSTDEEIGFPTWPGNAPDVQMQIEFFRARVQQSGFSDVMFGAGASQMSGFALSQLGDQNRIRLEQPIEHLELLLTSWAEKAFSLSAFYTKNSKGVHIQGTMKGSLFSDLVDFAGAEQFVVKAEIRPSFPNEQVRKHAMATQARGILSEWTLMENYYDIQQPDDEMARRRIEMAEKHPVVQMYAMISELKQMAKDGDDVAAMALQSIQNGNFPGAPGRPQEPNNPEQPLGLQTPTGSPTPPQQGDLASQMESMAGAAPNMAGGVGGGY